AALAAAQELAIPSGHDPEEFAADYATRNGGALMSCQCDPGSREAVVEVRMPVTLVFLDGQLVLTARARAVVDGAAGAGAAIGRALTEPAGTMAANGSDRTGSAFGQAPPQHRRRGLHAGQASPLARLPPGAPLSVRDLRRP